MIERRTEASELARVTRDLALEDGKADETGVWHEPLWELPLSIGAPLWSIPIAHRGLGLTGEQVIQRYMAIAEGSLTAAFILSQHDASTRRLGSSSSPAAARWLAEIVAGRAFTTVGLSQLTTSNRKSDDPLTLDREPDGSGRLTGAVPWVTGACRASMILVGALDRDGGQMLIALPSERAGVSVSTPFRLAALQASCTSEVRCENVRVEPEEVILGPVVDVMAAGRSTSGTGGLETSALAVGQTRAALIALEKLACEQGRPELEEPLEALVRTHALLTADLMAAARGQEGPSASEIRARSNALVLRATQAFLTARKGSGFVLGDPAQRWARQALFFLVWSCPGPVARASIRDLAGVCSV